MKIWPALCRHPLLVIGIGGIQFLFFLLLVGLTLHFQLKIMADFQQVLLPLQGANYDPTQLQEGAPFLQNSAALYQSFASLKTNIFYFILSVSITYLLGTALLWLLSQKVMHHQTSVRQYLQPLLLSIGLLTAAAVISYGALKLLIGLQVSQETFRIALFILLFSFFIVHYLLTIGYALQGYNGKQFVKKWYTTAVYQLHQSAPRYIANLILISAILYGIYWSTLQEGRFIFLLLCALLLIITPIITRLYWISFIATLHHEKSTA